MSEMSRDDLLQIVREVYTAADPVPTDLVARMQAAAAMAAAETDDGLDLELMMLVESSRDLAGTRGGASYTVRFAHGDVDLLLRIAATGSTARIDGWIVPAEPMTVHTVRDGDEPGEGVVADNGRFELVDLTSGLVRLRLEPHDGARPAFATPTFEI